MDDPHTEVERLRQALRAIALLSGNLPDEAVLGVGGINDARSLALRVVESRRLALEALDTEHWPDLLKRYPPH